MSGDVLVVTSGKGGVGKTTTSVNLAIALRQQGHSVAVLDADLGMPNVATFLSTDGETTLHDVLAGEASAAEAIVEIGEGLGFVFGERALEGFAEADPARLGDVVEALAERYQYVLVDTGGGLTYEGVYPMELADGVLLITSPIPAAIADTEKSKRLAERLGVPVRGVIVTHVGGDTNPESVASELDVDLLAGVPADDAVVESAAKRQPLVAYAPESAATLAYYRLAEKLSDPADAELEPLDAARKPSESGTADEATSTAEDTPAAASEPTAENEPESEPDGTGSEPERGSEPPSEDGKPIDGEGISESEETNGDRTAAKSKAEAGRSAEASTSEADSRASEETGFFGRLFGWLR